MVVNRGLFALLVGGLDDGSVRQHFQQLNSENGEWELWFDGRYVRQS